MSATIVRFQRVGITMPNFPEERHSSAVGLSCFAIREHWRAAAVTARAA
jgi:hypothetical protein